ncbi:hypothetical protein EDD86DRAFT_92630 [Gorgonomyces haynaldii]|nr:hypothetical protein EDD86DRAFT_92630 [Gorgonomyces haynaldii]
MCLSPPLFVCFTVVSAGRYMVSTFAGSGTAAELDGIGTAARFNGPNKITSNSSGYLYVTDYGGSNIRMISPSGVVTTLAGNSSSGYVNGIGNLAKFSYPYGICLDSVGNVYVTEIGNHAIRKITPNGTVSTFAGAYPASSGLVNGVGTSAKFSGPADCVFDSQDNMYVADRSNHAVRKITPDGTVTTLAGNGSTGSGYVDATGTSAKFNTPYGITISPSGDLYLADTSNNRLRKVTLAGVVTTVAGNGNFASVNGNATTASFYAPRGIVYGPDGNLYVAEFSGHNIRKVTLSGDVTTVAGLSSSSYVEGDETVAKFFSPIGLTVNSTGALFIADYNNNRIRVITNGTATTASTTATTETTQTTYVSTTTVQSTSDESSATVTAATSSAVETTATVIQTTVDATTLASTSSATTTFISSTTSSSTASTIASVSSTTSSSTASTTASVSLTTSISSTVSTSASATTSVSTSSSQPVSSSASATTASRSSSSSLSSSSSVSGTATSSLLASFTNLPLDALSPAAPASPLWWIALPLGAGVVGSAAFVFYRRKNVKKSELPQ